jgi:hypothetical protein
MEVHPARRVTSTISDARAGILRVFGSIAQHWKPGLLNVALGAGIFEVIQEGRKNREFSGAVSWLPAAFFF